MKHIDMYGCFRKKFPSYADLMQYWVPNDENSIRIRLKDGRQFIFNYYSSSNEWLFETIEHYIDRMSVKHNQSKGETQM